MPPASSPRIKSHRDLRPQSHSCPPSLTETATHHPPSGEVTLYLKGRRKPTHADQSELRKQITNLIIAALEEDCVPWRRPWTLSKNTGRPANALSKRPYSGINPLLLEMHACCTDFKPLVGDIRAVEAIGWDRQEASVACRGGPVGMQDRLLSPRQEEQGRCETGEEETDEFRVMRSWSVFNAEQVDGVEHLQVTSELNAAEFPDFAPADELIAATGADIRVGGDLAFYRRPSQRVRSRITGTATSSCSLTVASSTCPGAFYETALHELAHWSEVRLGWDDKPVRDGRIGRRAWLPVTSPRNCESLTASGSTTTLGTLPRGSRKCVATRSYIFKASTQASKVTDYLLSFVQQGRPRRAVVQEAI